MLQTSINNSSHINLRTKGLNLSTGKLHKGCVKDAVTKLSIGSIPSTYQSIIYKNQTTKAFGTSELRFYKKNNAEYQRIIDTHEQSFVESETTKASASISGNNHNVAGYGPLISKSKRNFLRTIQTPGPGQYIKYSEEQNKNLINRRCFTRQQNSRKRDLFHPINKQKSLQENLNQDKKNRNPGPGQYFHEKPQNWKKKNKGWKSSFQTKVDRNKYIPKSITPGPGVYDYSQQKQEKNRKQNKKVLSKNQINNRLLIDIIHEERDDIPGPGTYDHDIPDFKPFYEKIKLSKNFIAPNLEKKSQKKSPTATQYNVKRIYEDISPKLIESSVFMSESKRLPFKEGQQNQAQYLSCTNEYRSNFHFNIRNQWI